MPFAKGNKFSKGGARANSGRIKNWFRARCAQIIQDKKLVEFVARVANGEESDHKVSKDGDVIEMPASVHDRLYACEMLFDRGFGKPVPMEVDLTGVAEPLQKIINQQALLKMLYEFNFPDRAAAKSNGNGAHPGIVGSRDSSV